MDNHYKANETNNGTVRVLKISSVFSDLNKTVSKLFLSYFKTVQYNNLKIY